MHHRRGQLQAAGGGFVAAVRHGQAHAIAHLDMHRRPRHLIAERPCGERDARGDPDHRVRGIEADRLVPRCVERLERGIEAQRGAGGERARVARLRDDRGPWVEVHARRVVPLARRAARARAERQRAADRRQRKRLGRARQRARVNGRVHVEAPGVRFRRAGRRGAPARRTRAKRGRRRMRLVPGPRLPGRRRRSRRHGERFSPCCRDIRLTTAGNRGASLSTKSNAISSAAMANGTSPTKRSHCHRTVVS